MQNLLCLPHANVDVERVFSSVTFTKTKTRNRLHTSTVCAFIKVKDGVKSSGGCVKFVPPSSARQRMASQIMYSTSDSEMSESDTDLRIY